MNRSYSKIRHIQESNKLLEKRVISEQIGKNFVQLVKEIVNFFMDMNIIPNPIDGAKLLYNLYNSNDPVKVIKDFVYDRIPTPGENWKRIESSLDLVGDDISKFKSVLHSELKKMIPV